MNSTQLREQRFKLIADARQLLDSADNEKRSLSTEEQEKVDKLFADADNLANQAGNAERKEKLETAEAELRQSAGRKSQPVSRMSVDRKELDKRAACEILRQWAIAGTPGISRNLDAAMRAADHGFDINSNVMEYSYRAGLLKSTNSAGGYTVPQSFSSEIEKILAYYFTVQDAIGSFDTDDGTDYPYPTVTDTSNSASIVTEGSAIGTTTNPAFGQVVFKSWWYYSPTVLVSNQLLQDSAVDIPSLLSELFGERMGRAMDAAVVSANAGTSAPEGILHGVTASVNLASGNAVTYQKLLDLEDSVDLAYRASPSCAFLMHPTTWQAIRAVVDSAGRPLLYSNMQNIATGVDKLLLGYRVFLSTNMTSIASPGDTQPLILFGDMSRYKFRSIGGSTITKFNELYQGSGQVGFCMRAAYDARWLNAGAVKTLNSYDAP